MFAKTFIKKIFKVYLIKSILALTSIIHISFIGYNILNPELPEIKHYIKDLKNDFPISFSLCVEPKNILNVEDRIKELGYEHLLAFYYGRSKFNNGLFGWSGHSKNGSSLMSVEGLPKQCIKSRFRVNLKLRGF